MNNNCYMAYIQYFENKEIGDIYEYLTVLKKRGRGQKSHDFN